jgi:hypothetical protein
MSKIVFLAALGLASPVLGQASPPPIVVVPPAPAPDPARLALAHGIADRVLPPGAYQKVLQGSLNSMVGTMMTQMLDVPVRQFASMAGLSDQDAAKLGPATTRQIMAILDPAYERRMSAFMSGLTSAMGDVMGKFEPDMREGLAEAYAARFSAAQLTQIKAFYDTPAGSDFAAQQMTLMTDPALARRMQNLMPAILQAMPEVMKKAQADTASLPKAKKFEDLTDADKAKLAQLFGVPPEKLKKPRDPNS